MLDSSLPVVPNAASSYGCFYDKSSGSFQTGKYKTGVPVYGDVDLTTTVRYSRDAWLGYMRVTEGTGDFGMSKGQKLGIGIGLMVPSIFLFMIASWIYKKNRA